MSLLGGPQTESIQGVDTSASGVGRPSLVPGGPGDLPESFRGRYDSHIISWDSDGCISMWSSGSRSRASPSGYGSHKSTTSNMAPLQDALTALILVIGSYVAHLIWSRRRVQRGIANIPAPKSVSFWTGTSHRNYILHHRILIEVAYANI